MEREMGLPTVLEVWRLALPEATRLVSSSGDHTRPVSWAQRMAYHAPAFGALDEDEIVLLRVDTIRLLDERLTLTKVIGSLANRGTAAVAVVGPVSDAARQEADRRGRQVYRQLAQLSIENHGLPAIAEALVQIVHKPVVI